MVSCTFYPGQFRLNVHPITHPKLIVNPVNVTGSYFTALAFLELLDAGNKNNNVPQDSQIVITSSVAGYSRFLNSSVAYSTSKVRLP